MRAVPLVWPAMLRAAAYRMLLTGCGPMPWHSLMQWPAARPGVAGSMHVAHMQYACLQPGLLQHKARWLSLLC